VGVCLRPRDYVFWAVLALLLVPGVFAEPEVRPVSEATVFVDGSVDYLEIDGGLNIYSKVIRITAPDGEILSFICTGVAFDCWGRASEIPLRIRLYLDGTVPDPSLVLPIGDLTGAAVDGTWRIEGDGGFLPCGESCELNVGGKTLKFQGKSPPAANVRSSAMPVIWNWHESPGSYTDSNSLLYPGPVESSEYARYFRQGPSEPEPPRTSPYALTADNTVQCPDDLEVRGAWFRGATQVDNTFGRFWHIDGFQPSSTDLSLLPAALSTTVTDLGSGLNGTHNGTIPYSNLAGTSYQFEVRNGTTGEWQKGITLYAAQAQCEETGSDLSSLDHDENRFQVQAAGGFCSDERITLNVMMDKPLLGGEMFEVYVADANTGNVLGRFFNDQFYADPGEVNFFASFYFPPGQYVVVGLADIQAGASYDVFDSYPVSVSPEACVITFSDASLTQIDLLLQQIYTDSNTTADGALLVNSMDFAGAGFDGFLLLLLFAAFMAWSLWNNWLIPGLFGLIGATSVFYESFPIGPTGAIFLCLVALWLQWWMGQRLAKKEKVL